MTGCTFGKGNLIHLDYGKNAFTFIRRSDDKAIRVVTKPDGWGKPNPEWQDLFAKVRANDASPEEQAQFQTLHRQRAADILALPLEDIFVVTPVEPEVPAKARIHNSVTCADCGESVMETRSRMFRGETYCLPCFTAWDRRYS